MSKARNDLALRAWLSKFTVAEMSYSEARLVAGVIDAHNEQHEGAFKFCRHEPCNETRRVLGGMRGEI